jgi:hypothetical protein
VAGLLPGLALAYIAARLMESLLAGVRPADALTFSTAAALCLITTCWDFIPRASCVRTDPTPSCALSSQMNCHPDRSEASASAVEGPAVRSISTQVDRKPHCCSLGATPRDLQFRGPFLEMFSTERRPSPSIRE